MEKCIHTNTLTCTLPVHSVTHQISAFQLDLVRQTICLQSIPFILPTYKWYIYSYIRKLKDRRKEPDWQLLIQTFMYPQVMKHVNVLP